MYRPWFSYWTLTVTFRLAVSAYQGKPQGFASGTTGGGNAPASIPRDIAELKAWLTDDIPRTVLLDREYDFTGSQGQCIDCVCCPNWICDSSAGEPGQAGIDVFDTKCGDLEMIACTYYNSTSIDVASNKTIIGVGDKGVIRGSGFRFIYGASNIIVQNVHITDTNPSLVWGGDAIYMNDCDLIWIDHVKISLMGRQFITIDTRTSGRITISNSELDGRTPYSATCNGHHYWTIIDMGLGDLVTFHGNWIHHTSGRGPDLGNAKSWHIYNNYWSHIAGNAFQAYPEPGMLIEGNVFEAVDQPTYGGHASAGAFIVESDSLESCVGAFGRRCVPNDVMPGCGNLTAGPTANLTVFAEIIRAGGTVDVVVRPVNEVKSLVLANAGIGKMNSTKKLLSNGTRIGSETAIATASIVSNANMTFAAPLYVRPTLHTHQCDDAR